MTLVIRVPLRLLLEFCDLRDRKDRAMKTRNQRYHDQHRDEERSRSLAYRQQNPEQVQAYNRAYYLRTKIVPANELPNPQEENHVRID